MAPQLTVAGSLIDASLGYPLAGLRVVALRASAQARKPIAHAAAKDVQARVVSDANGRFQLDVPSDPPTRRLTWNRGVREGQTCILRIERADGTPYLVTTLTLPLRAPTTLRVPVQPRPVTAATWAEFGTRLEHARIGRLNEAVRQLTWPQPGGAFADWDAETRLGVLVGLEQAFLDPNGTLRAAGHSASFQLQADVSHVRSVQRVQAAEVRAAQQEMAAKTAAFGSLTSVDWPIDPVAFKSGDPGEAVTKFQSNYKPTHPWSGGDFDSPAILDEASANLVGYRDYLRAIWVSLNKNMERADENGAIAALKSRFHQDFRTLDTAEKPANELLIAILTDILVAPTGSEHGFGLSPSAVAARGSRSARDYLDYLIDLSGLTARELGLRYRFDLGRPDGAVSSAVQENIATLQGFYRDNFQCPPEPTPFIPPATEYADFKSFDLAPPAHVPPPFFLEYEEWLASIAPFFAENFYHIRPTYPFGRPAGYMYAREGSDDEKRRGQEYPDLDFTALNAAFAAGIAAVQSQRYGEALKQFNIAADAASQSLLDAAKADRLRAATLEPYADQVGVILNNLAPETIAYFKTRHDMKVADMTGLQRLLEDFDLSFYDDNRPGKKGQYTYVFLAACVFPVLYGDLALAMGDYPQAVAQYLRALDPRFVAGLASLDSPAGWNGISTLYQSGDLPYTFDVAALGYNPSLTSPSEAYLRETSRQRYPDASIFIKQGLAHPVEERFFRLRLGNAMLEWADALYRRDDASSTARARELYKGVLLLHGEMPPIAPNWNFIKSIHTAAIPAASLAAALGVSWLKSSPASGFVAHAENPALTSQKSRARLGFYQIESGLNYYGYHNDLVPTLRFRPLKDAADTFAALAKVAQQDWLAFMAKIEDAAKDSILTANMLKRTKIQSEIVQDQAKDAEYAIDLANRQVDAVRAAIEKKKQEIEDHDSFWGQVSDAASGFVNAFSSLPDVAKPSLSASTASDAAGTSDAAATAGASAADTQGAAALAAGGSIMLGYGAFVYASYKTIGGMADAANQRRDDLNTLENTTLPAAQEQVRVKQRDLDIVHLQGELVQADADLAHDLISFQVTRTLSPEFWASLANVMQRVLRRYLELGAKTAWLAERALSYEQDRAVRLIRFDYYPTQLYGITGADQLQADLAELEASRLAGIRETVPIKHTFSLLRDFPLQFGQLIKTGRCAFRTQEPPFRWAYPGTYGYRVRAVTVEVLSAAATPPLRGLLTNQGVSLLSSADGSGHVSVRPSDAFALSEFRLRSDMAVYSLPDEALLAFEGSGVDTFWGLEFPAAANPYGRDGLADVLLTFDVRASYSPDLRDKQLAAMPKTVQRLAVMSARRYQPKSLDTLRAGPTSPATLRFDLAALGLPRAEQHRKINNLVLLLAGDTVPTKIVASLQASAGPTLVAGLAFDRGVALSNVPPAPGADFPPPATPSPLNVLAGQEVVQTFTLTVDRAANAGVDFSGLSDVLLAIDYSADLV